MHSRLQRRKIGLNSRMCITDVARRLLGIVLRFLSSRKWSRTGEANSGQANEDRNDRSGNRLFSTLRPETSSYYTLPGFVQGTQILPYRKRQSPIDDRDCRPSPPRKSDPGAVSKKTCFSGDFAAANGFCPHFCDHELTLFLILSKTRCV